MKKGFLMLFAGLMVLGAAVQAMAGTRLDSMGSDVRQFDDQDIIWLYPSKALLYKDTVDFRLNGNDNGDSYYGAASDDYNEWGGVLKDMGDIGTLGLYVNRPESLYNYYAYTYQDFWGQYPARDWTDSTMYGQPFTPVGGVANWSNDLSFGPGSLQPENLADVFWAKNIEGIDFGAVVNYGDYQRYENNASDDARSLGINASAGFGAVGPFTSLNAHLGYQMATLDNPSSVDNIRDNGIYTIPFGLLGDISMGTDTSLRTFVDGQWNQFSLKNATTGYSEKDANNHYILGAAVNKKISGGKGLVTAGLFYTYGDWEYTNSANSNKQDYAYWDVIANIGVDAPVASWLNWRAGITKMVFSREFARTNGNSASYGDYWTAGNNWGSGESSFNTGFGVNVENWTLDANLSVGELEAALGDPSLGNFLFGSNSGAGSYPIFEVVTLDAKYKF